MSSRGVPVIRRRAFVELIMGMPISLHVKAIDPDRADIAAAATNAFGLLQAVDDVFSLWRPDSELSRLRLGSLAPGLAHPWQAEVAELTLEAEELTGGLFSAWHAWGERPTHYDPTGLVKGWAVERAADLMRLVPGISFCLNAGGDLVVDVGRDMNAIAPTWQIGIEDPRAPGQIARSVGLARGALATSGSAARGAHIIDPRTRQAIDRPGSATVIGPDLLWADIWATAAYVDPVAAARRLGESFAQYSLVLL